MPVSIVTQARLQYPQADEYFSPHERYPEYPYDHIAGIKNEVYHSVRSTLAQLGLDAQNYGSAAWNPLGEFITPGCSVFVLCNFVYHRRPGESPRDFSSKCTHASVLRAMIDYIRIAAGANGRIRFGNAPVQSCQWQKVLDETGASSVLEFYRRYGLSVEARDLRLRVVKTDEFGRTIETERRDDSEAVEVDLKGESLLRAHYNGDAVPRYRVLDYDPSRTEGCHSRESHRYSISRAILEADVVVSVPKLKTHEKVGLTCGLKGFVGTVGHKDCLAHHRFGGTRTGGDEYPSGSMVRHSASRFHDWVYSRDADARLSNTLRVADRNLRRVINRAGGISGGAWQGNDTAWRMSLDLARIVYHADRRGFLQHAPQRRHLCMVDGILGGEGHGPLRPTAARAASSCLVMTWPWWTA
jgi:uncharacterized protein (DUF362 family)